MPKNRTLWAMFVATFFIFASFTALSPVLPLHVREMGGSNFDIGIIMSAFTFGVLLFRPATSWLMTGHSRKWTLAFGSILMALASGLYFFSDTIGLLFFTRLLHGTGLAAFTTTSIVLISDVTTPVNRGQVMATVGIANYIGLGVGPFLADKLYNEFSIVPVFQMVLGFAVLGIMAVMIIRRQPKPDKIQQKKNGRYKAAMHRWFLIPSAFLFIIALVHGGITFFIPVYLEENSNLEAGVYFLSFSLAVLVFRILAGRISDRIGRSLVIFAGTTTVAVAVFLMPYALTLPLLIGVSVLYGWGYGSQQPAMTALIADRTTFENRGMLFSLYYSVFDIGMLLSGYVFGLLADWASVRLIFPVSSGLYVIGILGFVLLFKRPVIESMRWVFSRKQLQQKICPLCFNRTLVDPCHHCRSDES